MCTFMESWKGQWSQSERCNYICICHTHLVLYRRWPVSGAYCSGIAVSQLLNSWQSTQDSETPIITVMIAVWVVGGCPPWAFHCSNFKCTTWRWKIYASTFWGSMMSSWDTSARTDVTRAEDHGIFTWSNSSPSSSVCVCSADCLCVIGTWMVQSTCG